MQDKFYYEDMIDKGELKRLQEGICHATGVCACCVDADGAELTDFSGDNKEVMEKYLTPSLKEILLLRVEEGSLEEIATEDATDGVKAAAVSVRLKDRTVFNWLVLGAVEECGKTAGQFQNCRVLTQKAFYQVLDLLKEGCGVIFESRMSRIHAETESMMHFYSAREMKQSLDRIEAMAVIIQLLDSDDRIEAVMEKLLETAGNYLQITSAHICRLHQEKSTVDILAGWHARSIVPPFEKTKDVQASKLLFSEKPVIMSSDKIEAVQETEKWLMHNARAFMVFPLLSAKADGGMAICFNQTKKEHNWTLEEIKFASDAVKIMQSILTRRSQKESLAGSYASLATILDHVGAGIYVKGRETGQVLFANRTLKSNFERQLHEGTFEQLIEQADRTNNRNRACEIQDVAAEKWYNVQNTEMNWINGEKAVLYSLYDITDKKVYEKKIEQQALTDFLTGLYNRMCCEKDLAWYVDEAEKRGEKGGLLYIDLDNFKYINDGLGHQCGDILLKEISHALRRIEGIRTTCYRMGGDEFVVVIPPESYAETERILRDIESVFSRPWNLKATEYYCTVSVGFVTFPDDGNRVQDLIKKADIAMYEAKKTGRNKMVRYSAAPGSSSGRRLDMEKNMRQAAVAGCGEFEIYYQPIIDISVPGTVCTGAEALIRWNSNALGFLSPAEFIPLAEYLGLITPIGKHVLTEACRECKRWNESGHPGYKVNVNLSVVQLLQNDIVEVIGEVLEETKLNPHHLTLEVTESLAIQDMERMKQILTRIKALGVRIALDDFGTGYSSLNYIREFPFDVIKVDQSFVKDLAEDAYSQAFIKMVAELADTIGVSICVEGIETKEQYHVLEGMRVRMVQGYYFDKPMTQAEFTGKYV